MRPAALSADHRLPVVHEPRVKLAQGGGKGDGAFLQRGAPCNPAGVLTTPDGQLAPPEMVRRVGIGSRVRMVFSDVGAGLALPQWTIDEAAPQPAKPWRYPQE